MYLVTGNAGFIGFHTAKTLLEQGESVIGVDSVNSYYDVSIKRKRLEILAQVAKEKRVNYSFFEGNLAEPEFLDRVLEKTNVRKIIHLAAQAGVRYSLENPMAYVESNLIAFTQVLEYARKVNVDHLVYASTSSVYGANKAMPFSEHKGVDHPLQFYAATKRANELMAHSYSHLFRLPTTGLRFFTVYGPWGRPDMALFLFTKNIIEGKPIQVFNQGNHTRDFTYVSDIVNGILKVIQKPAIPNENWDPLNPDPASSNAPFRIYNIGNNNPVKLSEYIEALENSLGKKAIKELLPLQMGDVPDTFADVTDLEKDFNYKPGTPIAIGIQNFVSWYKDYFGI